MSGETNGVAVETPAGFAPLPSNWNTFYGERRAQTMLRLTASKFRMLVATRKVPRYAAPDGATRFDPKDIQALRDELDSARDAGEELDDDDDNGKPEAGSLRAGTSLVRQAQNHAERMFKLFEAPVQRTVEALSLENEALRRRCRELEQSNDAMVAAREKMLSEQHLRDLATRAVEADAKMKAELFDLVKSAAPALLERMGVTGVSAAQRRQLEAALELLGKEVKPSDLEALLLMPDFLSDRAKTLIRTILNPNNETPATSPAAATE